MTSDQQVSDLNRSVSKTTPLNPNANIFTSTKLAAAQPDKEWEGTVDEVFLTNGDLKPDDVGGGFSSGDSPVSASPPALESSAEPGPPGGMSPGPGIGANMAAAGIQMVEAEGAAASAPNEDAVVPSIQVSINMANGIGPVRHDSASSTTYPSEQTLSPSELRSQLKTQLEYYFSRENLVHDQYLQSQMDSDQYVPITTVANFNLVQKLTHDLDLIVEVLRNSKQVQVDEKGERVRPNHSRCVLMLREIPETTPVEEVQALFSGENCPKVVSCEFAHNSYWYITFETDEDATAAYRYLREEKKTFLNKPIMARIKAKPLMRTGPFLPNKVINRHHQPETPNFSIRPQTSYPTMPPFSQQVTQVSPFQVNYPIVMPQWVAPAPQTPAFLDPGTMLSINGYQATSIKPSTNNLRNIYPVRSNTRIPKTHHRIQVNSEKGGMDSRPVDRSYGSGTSSSARSSPRNVTNNHHHHHQNDATSHSTPFNRPRIESSTGGSHQQSHVQLHANAHAAPVGGSAPQASEDGPGAGSANNSRSDHGQSSQRRGGYRRSKRNEDTARNSRSNPFHPNKDGKAAHEPSFELEPTSFPPLPGQVGSSSSSDTPEGNKLSDVVKGTVRSSPRTEKEVKAIPATAVNVSNAASIPASTVITFPTSDSTAVTFVVSASSLTSSTMTLVTAPSTLAVKEAIPESSPVTVNAIYNSPLSNSAAEMLSHGKANKRGSPIAAAAPKSIPDPSITKAATGSNAHGRTAPSAFSQEAPARLSYAQMVQRKHQSENVEKTKTEDVSTHPPNATTNTCPAAQTTLREQSQTQNPNAASASPAPKSACASARPANKDNVRRDFDNKEQRFQNSRRAKENRDNRQPRFDRRRSERDVKMFAK